MKTYSFDVIATGLDHHAEDFENRFYRAGCSDALISVSNGLICIMFSRDAASIDAAILSATDAVMAAGATVIRIDRNF